MSHTPAHTHNPGMKESMFRIYTSIIFNENYTYIAFCASVFLVFLIIGYLTPECIKKAKCNNKCGQVANHISQATTQIIRQISTSNTTTMQDAENAAYTHDNDSAVAVDMLNNNTDTAQNTDLPENNIEITGLDKLTNNSPQQNTTENSDYATTSV